MSYSTSNNETFILFSRKRFIRAMFIGLNLIAYENNMQCLNLEQFIKQVNFFFSIVYPNTMFFEIFTIKILLFR